MNVGLVHIYCGNGKGKTTSAVGQSLRMAGHGFKVLFTQFLKDGKSGEISLLEGIEEICVLKGNPVDKFVFNMTDLEKAGLKEDIQNQFAHICQMVEKENYQMLVMDEILDVCNMNLLEEEKLVWFLKNKPKNLEVVLTGRNPSKEVGNCGDYISEINSIKHPFEKGITARVGVEY